MSIQLEFIGFPGPWRDPQKFVDALRAYKPSITDEQVVDTVHNENARRRPRHEHGEFHLFGADIMTDDLASIEAWPYLPNVWKAELPTYPIHGGTVISRDEKGAAALANARAGGSSTVLNRASWILPEGLSRTYVWCTENQFIQTVTDADADLLRKSSFRLMFRNPNLANGALEVHGYGYEVRERFLVRGDGVEAFERDMTQVQQWKGV